MTEEFNWEDPYDDMSDDELDRHFAKLFDRRGQSVAVSLRVHPDLLQRVKRQARRAGVPYQTFMKQVLDVGIGRLERKPATPRVSRVAKRSR